MKTAIVHYSVPPVVGGVEAVIQAHSRLLLNAGYAVRLVAGAGEQAALPPGTEFHPIPEMDTLNRRVVEVSTQLQTGQIPGEFELLASGLEESLAPALEGMDHVMIHNIFTKHFNLPLTAALNRMLDRGQIRYCISWCHDITWTSPHSRSAVHPGYPWDLLRTYRQDVTYVAISRRRQQELANLYGCPLDRIHVIYDGVDPAEIYSLSGEAQALVERLKLDQADLILLMPVRITQAKNIELALKVVSNLKSAGIRPKLVVTGPPDPHDPTDLQYYQSLLNLRAQLNVDQEVRFVYESGPSEKEGYTIGLPVLRELFRACDALFMPSHREGFGMPVLEAGLVGMPVFTTSVPAAEEVGEGEVSLFSPDDPAASVAARLLSWLKSSPSQGLRRRVRQNYTWQAIFQQAILPLLARKEAV